MSLRRREYLDEAVRAKRGKFEVTIGNPHVPSSTEKEERVGYIVGNLGIHKMPYGEWTVTHLPTGLSGGSGLPTLKAAKLYALYFNKVAPKSSNVDKVQSAIQSHYRDAMDYRRYLQDRGDQEFAVWKKTKKIKEGREDMGLRRRGYLEEGKLGSAERKKLENEVWKRTSKDYRSMYGGERHILWLGSKGTTLKALGDLTDEELLKKARR